MAGNLGRLFADTAGAPLGPGPVAATWLRGRAHLRGPRRRAPLHDQSRAPKKMCRQSVLRGSAARSDSPIHDRTTKHRFIRNRCQQARLGKGVAIYARQHVKHPPKSGLGGSVLHQVLSAASAEAAQGRVPFKRRSTEDLPTDTVTFSPSSTAEIHLPFPSS